MEITDPDRIKSHSNMDQEITTAQEKEGEDRTTPDPDCEGRPRCNVGFDEALEKVGSWGPWQKKFFVFASMGQCFTAMHAVAAVFLGANMDHWCRIPGVDYEQLEKFGISSDAFKNISIPRDKDGEYSKCEYNNLDYGAIFNDQQQQQQQQQSNLTTEGIIGSNNTYNFLVNMFNQMSNTTEVCNEYIFDTNVFSSTVISEWSLVCGRRWLSPTVQATYMGGLLVGSLVMGQLSDRFGRRTVSMWSALGSLICGVIAAFVPNYLAFLFFRFFVAWLNAGIMVTNFVLVMEVVHSDARAMTGMLYAVPYGVGICLLSGIAYFVRNWRYLQIVICILFSPTLLYFWFLPESPRWLASKGRVKEALAELKKIAHGNGTSTPDEEIIALISKEGTQELIKTDHKPTPKEICSKTAKGCLSMLTDQAALVRTPVMRRRCLICFFTWFVGAMVYYGLIFSGDNIQADLFLMISVSGFVEIPACIIFAFLLKTIGRRICMCGLFVVCGVFCLIILAVPKDFVILNITLANVGKFFNTAVFQQCYVYTAELTPTPVRNIAMGTSSMFGRVGSSIAPYIVDLLGAVHYTIPSTLFGALSIAAGLLALLLPETAKMLLPETIAEVEAMPK